jgi:hypothetical protein
VHAAAMGRYERQEATRRESASSSITQSGIASQAPALSYSPMVWRPIADAVVVAASLRCPRPDVAGARSAERKQ